MHLEVEQMLRDVRDILGPVAATWERPVHRDDLLLNDYQNLTVTLGALMQATQSVQPNLPGIQPESGSVPVLPLYAQGFAQFLIIALRQQWTHVLVLEEADLAKLARFPQMSLQHQFMGIQTMLGNAYHQKRQNDFSHAWRSYLKLGLYECQFSVEAVNQAVFAQLDLDKSV